MYKVKCLKDFGTWCRKGKVMQLNNHLAETFEKRGYLKIIEFLGNYNSLNPNVLKDKINQLNIKIKVLETQRDEYEKLLKKYKK